MKNLKKITVHNAEDVLSNAEMRVLTGGYGDGVAKKCEDFTNDECTEISHTCWIDAGNSLVEGKCKWETISFPGFHYAGCSCVVG